LAVGALTVNSRGLQLHIVSDWQLRGIASPQCNIQIMI